MKDTLKIKCRQGMKDFSIGTSLHGFAELYNAQTTFWKAFWIVILFGSCAITVYQIDGSIMQYFNNPTLTVISVVNDSAIYYPPLKVCYWQWFYWVDWKKAMAISPNPEVFHYAFHYVNGIFSSNIFDLPEAKKMLNEVMATNNFSQLFDLYKAIAKPTPMVDGDTRNISKYFQSVQLINGYPYYRYCYTASADSIYRYFHNSTNSTIAFYTIDETYQSVKPGVTEDEYNYYIAKWIDRASTYVIDGAMTDMNLTKIAPPISIVLDDNMDNAVDVYLENDEYTITLKGLAYTWLNKDHNPCSSARVSVANNQSCLFKCRAMYVSAACNCLYIDEAIELGKDQPTKVCYKDINFIFKNHTVVSVEKKQYQNCSNRPEFVRSYDQCLAECVPACQIWKYEIFSKVTNIPQAVRQVGRKKLTKITIIYPSGTDIVSMTEINAQSWENFIGNVGGILGIWTGASLVSIIQLVYLCCFSHQQKFSDWFSRSIGSAETEVSSMSSAQENIKNSQVIHFEEKKY